MWSNACAAQIFLILYDSWNPFNFTFSIFSKFILKIVKLKSTVVESGQLLVKLSFCDFAIISNQPWIFFTSFWSLLTSVESQISSISHDVLLQSYFWCVIFQFFSRGGRMITSLNTYCSGHLVPILCPSHLGHLITWGFLFPSIWHLYHLSYLFINWSTL